MKPIVVQDQIRLGPGRCLQLALTGMGYRMFRSMITVTILALAVAFLVHVLSHGLLSNRVIALSYRQLEDQRALGQWVTRLGGADDMGAVLRSLGGADVQRLAEYQKWSAASEGEMKKATEHARVIDEFTEYLEGLPGTSRVVLTSGQDVLTVLRGLMQQDKYQLFVSRLVSLKVVEPLGSRAGFDELVRVRLPEVMRLIERIREGQARAIAGVRKEFDGQSPLVLLSAPPVNLEAVLRGQGFSVPEGSVSKLAQLAQADSDREHLSRQVLVRQVRDQLAKRMQTPVPLVTLAATLNWLTNSQRASWLAEVLKEKTGDTRLSAERLLSLAENYRKTMQLIAAVGDQVPNQATGLLSLPTATYWLIGLSFLVCAVGVANAMLMSVTERFAEIATMKCLGAMDTFVMLMFLFEAKLQGFFGGIAGLILGLILAVIRLWVEYSNLAWPALDIYPQVLWGALWSLIVGILLAGLAAVWPAYVAARLAPMEAMRVE